MIIYDIWDEYNLRVFQLVLLRNLVVVILGFTVMTLVLMAYLHCKHFGFYDTCKYIKDKGSVWEKKASTIEKIL